MTATVVLPESAGNYHRAGFSIRTRPHSSGNVCYELVDDFTGRVRGRSRTFGKIKAALDWAAKRKP